MATIHTFRKNDCTPPQGLEEYILVHYTPNAHPIPDITIFESIQREIEEKKTLLTHSIRPEIDALADTSSFAAFERHDCAVADPSSLFSSKESDNPRIASSKRPLCCASATSSDVRFKLDESFSAKLINILKRKNISNSQCYKKAHIDRRLFSKICSNNDYRPAKRTALALAIALELNLDETRDFIGAAGFSLSHSLLFDVIVEFFISKGFYDVFEINQVLYEYDQSLLGE